MIATSDWTAPIAMITAAKMAGLKGMSSRGVARGLVAPKMRPSTMKITTGTTSVPMNPIGSRAKILVSTQLSFQNPRRNPGRIISP
jgi:hypothetical protein